MDYVLWYSLTEDDIEFLNVTSIEFEIFNPAATLLDQGYDSGWCDMSTGARIIGSTDRVAFLNVDDEDLLLLTLKFQDRLKKLNNGFKKMHKYNANIR
jgi:hypothetical protein